jgi:alpha-galactosidase
MMPLFLNLLGAGQTNTFLLESLDLRAVSQGYGDPGKAVTVDHHPLTLAGKVYPTGLGTHSRMEFLVGLGGKGKRFQSVVGLDDETNGRGSIRFLVYGDGKLLSDSGVMRSGAAKTIDVSLTRVKVLRLVVDEADDGISYDHADWANATLEMLPGAKPKVFVLPVEPPMSIAHHQSSRTEIHGTRIVGGSPGKPFLYKIPATGLGKLRYSVTGLPQGLGVDERGVISGKTSAGTYDVSVQVVGGKGTDSRPLRIVIGENKLALTPPMGWNSWNVWANVVDADKIRAAADAFIKTGLADYGYRYVNIDDCWEKDRNAAGEIQTNERFPDMESLSAYVHGKGLLMGIYSSPGPFTCGGYVASYGHELQDAQSYAKWGVDYLKYDWCSYGEKSKGDTLYELQKPYLVMYDALKKQNRDIVYSLCQYGMGDVYKWGTKVGGNLWRTTGDITDTWQSMSSIGFSHSERAVGAGPGGWNDPDMLVVGSVGWGNPHPTKLTPNEQITHISLWSLLAAPLIIGCDLTKIDSFTQDLLMNHEVIDIDQDPLGRAAVRIAQAGETEVWSRPLFDGRAAIGLFNRGSSRAKVTVKWSDLHRFGAQQVRDAWNRRDLGRFEGSYTATVPAHGCVLITSKP